MLDEMMKRYKLNIEELDEYLARFDDISHHSLSDNERERILSARIEKGCFERFVHEIETVLRVLDEE